MKLRLTGAVLVLLAAASCGSDQSDGGETPAKTADSSPELFAVKGVVKVDLVGGVRPDKTDPSQCEALGDLRQTLKLDTSPVVITAPNGDEVALAKFTSTNTPTYKDDGQEYYGVGVCNFLFETDAVPAEGGVFKASIPDLGIEARFSRSDAAHVVLTYDPS